MTGSAFNLDVFQQEPVIGIVRGVIPEVLSGVMDAAVAAGLKFIEITLNTPGAIKLIETVSLNYSVQLCVGAGTVLSRQDAEAARAAGAKFIVSPTLNEEVAAYCRESQLAYFPGAYTPTEIEKAWNAGASMVKVFPASRLGPGYFKEVKGPFNHIPLMAVGGVRADNIEEFYLAGASAIALGASVFSPARMKNSEFGDIRENLQEIMLEVRKFYTKLK